MPALRTLALLGVASLAVTTLVACSDDEEVADDAASTTVSGNVLSVVLDDYSFAISGEPVAGTVTIQIENAGGEFHELAMGRLADGKTLDDLRGLLESAGEEEPDLDAVFEGGDAEPIDDLGGSYLPGTSLAVTGGGINAGNYVVMCYVPNAEGTPHWQLGMMSPFTIAEGDATDTPEADATYTATADGLDGPETLPAGETVLSMVNDSDTTREIAMLKLSEGKTMADLGAFFELFSDSAPSAEDLAGDANPLDAFAFIFDAEQDRQLTVELTPGTWAFQMADPEQPFEGSPEDDPNAVIVQVS